MDGIAPQPGANPRLSALEEWPERTPRFQLSDEIVPALSPPVPEASTQPTTATSTAGMDETRQATPTEEQRLEFLRYLVQRGLINEGFAEKRPDTQTR